MVADANKGGQLQLTGTINNVTGRKVKTKFGEKDVFDIHFSDGNVYGTFKEALAAEASRAKGIEGVVISLESNGDFTNFGGVVSTNGTPPTDDTPNIPFREGFDSPSSDTRQKRISALAAYKIAASLLSGSGATLDDLDAVANHVLSKASNPEDLPEWAE